MAQLFAEESVASVQTTVCRCNPVAAKAFTILQQQPTSTTAL